MKSFDNAIFKNLLNQYEYKFLVLNVSSLTKRTSPVG